jgi:hypothetical protein
MRKSIVLLAVAVATACGVADAATTAANTNINAHANMCMPATNDLTRTSLGIRNDTTGNRGVYCGFQIREGLSESYEIFGVTLRNYGASTQVVNCYWLSGEPFEGGYATYTQSVQLLANGGTPTIFYGTNLGRPNSSSSLGLRCALPPGTAMDHIVVWAASPPPA